MKEISNAKLKTYLLMIFLVISIFGGVLDILFTYGDTHHYLDLENMYDTVYADSTNSGFNFFTDSIDISIGVSGSFQYVDVSAHIPAGSTGVMLDIVNLDGGSTSYDVRHPDSTDDFTEALILYTGMHVYAYVGVNSSLIFEMYISMVNIDCYLLGYTDSAVTYFTDVIDYQMGSATAWNGIDLSANVPEGATGVIMRAYNTGASLESGIRHPDSTDQHTADIRANGFQMCGVNSSRMIEAWIESTAIDHYLVAYTTSPVQFNVNWDDVSLGGVSAWTNIDVTAHTTPNATGVIIWIEETSGGWVDGSIREDGSTDNRVTNIGMMLDGQTTGVCGLGSGEILEAYIDHVDCDMWVVGYFAERVVGNVVFPDHVESSSGVINATDTLTDDEVFAEADGNGWIIWDFGEEITNVTALRWEIVAGGSGVIFRIEGSQDLASWDTLAQPTQSLEGGPPPVAETNGSTRYDSEVHLRYRYYRLIQVKPVIPANPFWIDYFCLIIQPPAISYADGSYFYPMELEYIRWDVYGDYGADENFAYLPHNALGEDMANPSATNRSTYTYLVNADDHPLNYIVLKMDDFYNITNCEALVNYGTSWYLWVSQYADNSYQLVDSWNDPPNTWDWYGHTINASFIRYIKLNATGISTNKIDINAIRLTGVLSGGTPAVGVSPDEFNFYYLPEYIEDLLGLPAGSGSFLSSLIVMSAFLLPIAVYDRKGIIAMIVGVACFGFLVLIGWLPSWLMLIMILLVAGIFAFNFSKWFGGKG